MAKGPKLLIPAMVSYIRETNYDLYVEATWHQDEQSTFFRQSGGVLSLEDAGPTASELESALSAKPSPLHRVHKTTRSAFKAPGTPPLLTVLRQHKIEDIHLFGLDINDCVLATAFDATDFGFFTCVVEELSHHHQGIEDLKAAAIAILRRQNMTNNSLLSDCQIRTLNL
jgi:nicotinamidase-related amidase